MEKTYCSICGAECVPTSFYDEEKTKPINTGYGVDKDGNKVCFACCGEMDKKTLRETGTLRGYLIVPSKPLPYQRTGVEDLHGAEFTNWPGSFRVSVDSYGKRSFNNFGAPRTDFWFFWEGRRYHGVNVGDNSQCATVKVVKSKH